MKNLKNFHNTAGQSSENLRKPNKHDANLQKNSTLYFQIGLILCLITTYSIFEMEFKTNPLQIEDVVSSEEIAEITLKNYVVEQERKPEKQVEQKSQKLSDTPPIVIDDDLDIVEPKLELVEPAVLPEILPVDSFEDLKAPAEEVETPLSLTAVERVPIYPGCEDAKTNAERIKCMSQKMGKLIQRKFNTGLAENGMSGIQRIDVKFKIDKDGKITDVITRAPSDLLEREAKRVVNKIPTMKPGMQRNQPVAVMYYLPIRFQVMD